MAPFFIPICFRLLSNWWKARERETETEKKKWNKWAFESNCYSFRHRKVIKYLCIFEGEIQSKPKEFNTVPKREREGGRKEDMQFDVNLSGSSPAYNMNECTEYFGWFQIGTFILCKVYYCYCITLHFGNAHHHLFCFRCNCFECYRCCCYCATELTKHALRATKYFG